MPRFGGRSMRGGRHRGRGKTPLFASGRFDSADMRRPPGFWPTIPDLDWESHLRKALSECASIIARARKELPCYAVRVCSKRESVKGNDLSATTAVSTSSGSIFGYYSKGSILVRLPKEVRYMILEYCISDALLCRRCLVFHKLIADVTRNMHISGIGPLPILFVNNQLHGELLRLVYSKLCPVEIHGYYLRKGKGPDEFRQLAYPAKWPQHRLVQNFTRKVTVTLTYGRRLNRNWAWDGYWYYLTLNCPGHIAVYDPNWSVIPDLVKYLSAYKSLSEIEIVIEVHQSILNTVPNINDFNRLLPLYDLFGRRTIVTFKTGSLFQCDLPLAEVTFGWMAAWKKFLVENGHPNPERKFDDMSSL